MSPAERQKLEKRLKKIQAQLDSMPIDSALELGWQTQRYAKTSRKRDMLAEEKMQILIQLDNDSSM